MHEHEFKKCESQNSAWSYQRCQPHSPHTAYILGLISMACSAWAPSVAIEGCCFQRCTVLSTSTSLLVLQHHRYPRLDITVCYAMQSAILSHTITIIKAAGIVPIPVSPTPPLTAVTGTTRVKVPPLTSVTSGLIHISRVASAPACATPPTASPASSLPSTTVVSTRQCVLPI